ncbi:restriction endonuclease subunit S [Accumulibacter sp.]|uniref:restriction endonuclease subunit S n=1 Tax=Accumulibacter sp. TaxID=2053492 RepID=UPI0028C3874B|nr:restriction endonuclease subunit S [Accumulibacter sp.]
MDAQQFLAEFGHIANAPGGIQQLREMVYQLAITGTLTSQLDTDGDARELLADISTLRDRLIREKTYKRLPKLEAEALDIPSAIELPVSWCWTRLLDVGEISPRNDAPDEAAASFIPMSGFSEFHMGALAPEAEKWAHIKKGFTHFRNGDVVVAKITPCFENGKAAVIDGLPHEIGAGTTELHVFRPIHAGILPGYIYLFLRSPYFAIEGEKGMTGTAGQKRLPTEYFATRALPLPPSTEQSRIVAKVDELMALCDKLETQQQARRKLQNNLRQSTLQAVASATSPHELQTTWARLADNFGRLFHAPEDVAELRGLILDMAMRGYLVEQDAMDEPAVVLCVDIESKKRELSNARKLKLQKSLSQIGEDEIPFDVPTGWEWIRLGQIAELINGDRGKNYPNKDEYVSVGVPWINTGHIEPDGTLTRHHMNFISREKFESLNSGKIESSDLVYCLRGATFGKTAFVTPYEEGAIASSLMIIRPIIPSLSRFLYYYLISPLGRSQIFRFDNGTAQPNLSANSVGLFSYPLPPLQEQSRIADKIEQLMRICDALELQLHHATEVAGRLAVAAVSSLTGIAIEQEEEAMKAPQTELVAQLRLGTAPDIKAQALLATILARHNGEMSAKDLWQRFGGEIDAFYAQLKTEVAHGWIVEPAVAEMREKQADAVSA